MSTSRLRPALLLAAAVVATLAVSAPAEARRGGSFGSRGSRTYAAPRSTYTTPGYVPPVQRSMTPYAPGTATAGRPSYAPAPAAPAPAPGGFRRPGLGFGGGLAAGLLTGGLIGSMLGHGWGGLGGGWGGAGAGAGMLGGLLQLALLALLAVFVVRMFRRRNEPAPMAYAGYDGRSEPEPGGATSPWGGTWTGASQGAPSATPDMALSHADEQAFERLLTDVQEAFGREDYAAIRERTTPEIMSYLAEELSQNATHGRRNEVSRLRLLRSDVSEAWREDDADYATVAMNYESVDVMRDRQTGAVLEGDPDRPTATTELWTFIRRRGEAWKVSAIQET